MIVAIKTFGSVGAVLIPAIPVGAACAMILSALAFSMYRGDWLKVWLAKCWSARRREVLHLDVQNGFYFFMERLMTLSKRLLWLSVGLGVAAALVVPQAVPSIALIVSLGMVFWAVVLRFIACRRVNLFANLLDWDGHGSIGLSRADWSSRERAARSFLVGATAVFMVAAFLLLSGG